MKELEEKIREIFHDYQVTHGGLTLVAKEISALIEPIQTRLDIQIKVNDDLLLINRDLESKLQTFEDKNMKQAKLVDVYDAALKHHTAYRYYPKWMDTKIEQLKKELK